MRVIYCLMLALMTGGPHCVQAQVVSTLPVSQQDESFFLYEVKFIDEFIERFNDDKESYIRQQCRTLYGTDSFMSRQKLMRALFDKTSWCADAGKFIQETEASGRILSFADPDWYAIATCVFTMAGKRTELPLVLHIKTENGASRWMIAGMGAFSHPEGKTAVKTGRGDTFIPTSSHGTNFVVLTQLLAPGLHPEDLFEPQLLAMPRARQLIAALEQGKAKFQFVKRIRYQFYQLPGWVVTVEQFKRKNTNSGWLVSGLQPGDAAQKKALLDKLLYP